MMEHMRLVFGEVDGEPETVAAEMEEVMRLAKEVGGMIVSVVSDDGDMKRRRKEFERLTKEYQKMGCRVVRTKSKNFFVIVPEGDPEREAGRR